MFANRQSLFYTMSYKLRKTDAIINGFINKIDSITVMWILAVLYRIILDFTYVFAVSSQYSYAGLKYNPNSIKYIISLFLYFIVFFLLPKKEMEFDSFFLNIQFAIVIAPMLTYYALNSQSTVYMLMIIICVVLQILILVINRTTYIKSIHIVSIKPYSTIILGLVVLLSVVIPILYNGFAGLKTFNLNFLYLLRENNELPPVIPYFIQWTYSVILPFGIVYSLQNKRYLNVFIFLVMQLIMFILTGAKSVYLYVPVIVFIYFIASKRILLKGLYAGLVLGCIAAIVFERFTVVNGIYGLPEILAISFFGIRFLFIPAFNKFEYYRFFHDYPFNLFSDGQIGRLFSLSTPYKGALGRVIASFSTGQPMGINNSNTGYLGDSYAQAGFIGMLCMSIILAIIIKFVSRISKGYHFAVIASLFSVSFIILNDAALLTTLFSGGMIVLILLVIIYQDNNSLNTDLSGECNK